MFIELLFLQHHLPSVSVMLSLVHLSKPLLTESENCSTALSVCVFFIFIFFAYALGGNYLQGN